MLPGQFVNYVDNEPAVMLRRPISESILLTTQMNWFLSNV